MNLKESFVNTRKIKELKKTIGSENTEEEYYKWKIRDLERRIRDTRREITKIKNIKGL